MLVELRRAGRPERARSAAAYFKSYEKLRFFGADAATVRRLAARVQRAQRGWTRADAQAFADLMIARPQLEAKGLGICLLGKYRKEFTPGLLPVAKRWLQQHCTDWASTDNLCSEVLDPLLSRYPALVERLRAWRTSPYL